MGIGKVLAIAVGPVGSGPVAETSQFQGKGRGRGKHGNIEFVLLQ